jgi:hypothetical protein
MGRIVRREYRFVMEDWNNDGRDQRGKVESGGSKVGQWRNQMKRD